MNKKFVSLLLLALAFISTAKPAARNLSQDIINAAATGNVEQLQKIIAIDKKYANVRVHHNWTPLHYAAGNGHLECVRALVAHGADVNTKTSMISWTPLHLAVRGGHDEIVKELLMHKAAVHALNGYDETPLDLARNALPFYAHYSDYYLEAQETHELFFNS